MSRDSKKRHKTQKSVYPRLMWWWSFVFPPNSQEPPLQNIYILLNKLPRELQWERHGVRKDIWSLIAEEVAWKRDCSKSSAHQLLTFKLYYLTSYIPIPVCSRSFVSSPSHGNVSVCEYVLRDGWRGDVYDPPRRRKNKQNRNEEEKEEQRRRRNNKNKTKKQCFHAFSSCFPMEKQRLSSTACYNRVNEPGGIWNWQLLSA